MKLADVSEEDIEEIADSGPILARGLEYFENGDVKDLSVRGSSIVAKVQGNSLYTVEISVNDEISAECSCPYDGYGCKHVVAVLYRWLRDGDKKPDKTPKAGKKKAIDLKKEISGLSRDELISTLATLCDDYEDVRKDLTLRISGGETGGDVLKIIGSHIESALHSRNGFIDYHSVPEAVRRLRELMRSILRSSPDVRTPLLRMLAEKSIKTHGGGCDDSAGLMGGFVVDCLTEIGISMHEQDLSHKEKKQIILDNFDLLEKEEYGLEDGYVDLILAVPSTERDFEFLIGELKARSKKQAKRYMAELYKGMLVEIYAKTGKDDERLSILKESAEKEGNYFSLVRFWREKGDLSKAVEVAEEGIKRKKDLWNSDSELLDFLEEAYGREKDAANLLRVLNLRFKENPSLSTYKKIMDGTEPGERDLLKKKLVPDAGGRALIEILLFEKEFEKACEKLAESERDYSDRFRDKVARTVVKRLPERALKIYLVIAKQFIEGRTRDDYVAAAFYAGKIKDIYSRIDQKNKWKQYIAGIREGYRKRPALIDEFKRL